jgi:hypothetical protein
MSRPSFAVPALVFFAALSAYAAPGASSSNRSISRTAGTSIERADTTSSASTSNRRLLTLEIIGNSSEVKYEETAPTESYSSRASGTSFGGVSAGITVKESEKFGVSGDIALFHKKFDSTTVGTRVVEAEGESSERYLTLRTTGMARYSIVPQLSIGAGPYLSSFLGNARVTDAAGNTEGQSLGDYQDRIDYGLAFGARAEIVIQPRLDFIVDLRYFHGLANLLKDDNLRDDLVDDVAAQGGDPREARRFYEEVDFSVKTRDFQFGAGLAFKF